MAPTYSARFPLRSPPLRWRVVRLCVAATADRVLITSIVESAPNPIKSYAARDNTGTDRHQSIHNVPPHREVLTPQGTMVQSDAAFRRRRGHEHLGYGHRRR